MDCGCKLKKIYIGNEVILFKEKYLEEIKVDAYNWKTLYKCKKCSIYWEETYLDGRFGGIPKLKEVDKSYIKKVWNLDL